MVSCSGLQLNPFIKVPSPLGGDARGVSAAPTPASLRRPGEDTTVRKAFNQEVLVVRSRSEPRGCPRFMPPASEKPARPMWALPMWALPIPPPIAAGCRPPMAGVAPSNCCLLRISGPVSAHCPDNKVPGAPCTSPLLHHTPHSHGRPPLCLPDASAPACPPLCCPNCDQPPKTTQRSVAWLCDVARGATEDPLPGPREGRPYRLPDH
jgi:hypothetical protein